MTEERLQKMINKWVDLRQKGKVQRQNAVMAGASRKDISAMDAYISMFDNVIHDLYSLK